MTHKLSDKQARLAQALRENLKKRKAQRSATSIDPANEVKKSDGTRRFREKPIKPSGDLE